MPLHEPEHQRGLVWFRRDLRMTDHAALYHALRSCRAVRCVFVFVFDSDILDPLLAHGLNRDRRVEFTRHSVVELASALADATAGSKGGLIVRHGGARELVPRLADALKVNAVFVNHDYEPDAIARDEAVAKTLRADGRVLRDFKDQVIFEKDEILTQGGTPFSVFTPYRHAWMKTITPFHVTAYPVERYTARLAALPESLRSRPPTLSELGFAKTNLDDIGIPAGASGAQRLFDEFAERIAAYREARDYPHLRGTSYLSVHLRFGTISIRALARAALNRTEIDRMQRGAAGAKGAETWLSELIWRDFYFQILHHRPDLGRGAAFKPQFERIIWEKGARADDLFDAWCTGATGYPLVDAAMTQINGTGFMHNRLRMVTASFLAKDLGLDWRWGERYFAAQLNDFDLAANNGGWQWAASSGCDAQPWFRIFNPVTQSRKFDPDGAFIRRYLPGLAKLSNDAIHAPWLASASELARAGVVLGRDYPEPNVDHEAARQATLERYAVVREDRVDSGFAGH
jgi:deoxyribodipyrimidine photo-lyase